MKDKGVKIAAIISASVIIVALIAMYTIFQIMPTQTISVRGEAQIDVTPDLFTVNFNLESRADTASEAKDANTEKYNEFVEALGAIDIDEEDIKTVNINVYPEYDWINGNRIEKGFIASHSVKVELPVADSDKIGEIIDVGVDSGALISYINFELSEELQNEKKAEATVEATADAKIKAESMAQGLGHNLGKIVSVSDSSFNYNPWPLYYGRDDVSVAEAGVLAKETVQAGITPGDRTVYASVNVVYKIN